MTSSTSPSEKTHPKPGRCVPSLAAVLLLVAVCTTVVSYFYVTKWNPEIAFWKLAVENKNSWVQKLRSEQGEVIGIIGGSTTTFGMDAAHIYEKHGLPVANLGLHAGMGADFSVAFGLSLLEPGDTLIVSIEPALLQAEVNSTPLASQLAHATGKPELLDWRSARAIPALAGLGDLRPGGYHAFTMLGKLALGMPAYRYDAEGIRPGGLQVTAERRPMPVSIAKTPSTKSVSLSEGGRRLLEHIKTSAQAQGIRVYYLLPWAFVPPKNQDTARLANERFLEEIERILPVIYEPQLGVHSVAEDFADTPQHLTAEAAVARSEVFAREYLRTIAGEKSGE
jgi:hypothetical protein